MASITNGTAPCHGGRSKSIINSSEWPKPELFIHFNLISSWGAWWGGGARGGVYAAIRGPVPWIFDQNFFGVCFGPKEVFRNASYTKSIFFLVVKLGCAIKTTLFIHAETAFYTDLSLANIAILLHLRQDCCIWDTKIWDDGSHAMSHPKTCLAGSFYPKLIPVTAQPWWSHLQLN